MSETSPPPIDSPHGEGRQHHTSRKGTYTLPNDNYDLERLDTVHIMILSILDGELFLAPIDQENIQSVLDIGTGSGTLAIELGDLLPRAQVIGCDLSPVQPTWVPPNVKFEVDDVESEWTYNFKFDYIISRAMTCSIANWSKFIQNIYDNLGPGAWGELQDFDLEICTDDDTVTDDHYIKKYYADLVQGASLLKRSARPGPKLLELAKAAGFINLEEQVFKVPLGPWPQDEDLKRVGMLNMLQVLDGLDSFSFMALPMLGYSKEEIGVLIAHVRREINSRTLHIYFKFFVVYGQKP